MKENYYVLMSWTRTWLVFENYGPHYYRPHALVWMHVVN